MLVWSTQVFHLQITPLWLDLATQVRFQHKFRFRFENIWTREPVCSQLIKDIWLSHKDVSVTQKLEDCKLSLEVWGKGVTGKFHHKLSRCKTEMNRICGSRVESDIKRFEELNNEFFNILQQKEIY